MILSHFRVFRFPQANFHGVIFRKIEFSNIKLSFFASHMKSTTLVADPLATLETSIAYCPKRMRTLLNLEYYLKMQILADLSPPVHLQ